jgi:hypothetical protein
MRFTFLVLGVLLAVAAFSATTPPRTTTPPRSTTPAPQAMTPAQRAQMMQMMQDIMVMMNNTAVWTPQGLYVLQGNNLLMYTPTLTLAKTVALPTPAMPPAGTMANIRGMVPARILTTDNGIVVVRGQQILRFDANLTQLNTALLPNLAPLTATQMAAVCPMCTNMQMWMGMGNMSASTMGGATMSPSSMSGCACGK